MKVYAALLLLLLIVVVPGGDRPAAGDREKESLTEPVLREGQRLVIPTPINERTTASLAVTEAVLPSDTRQVALTFDIGCLRKSESKRCPVKLIKEPSTRLLLLLENLGVKATFYPQASWLKDYPEVGREIVRQGHGIGNHSLTHAHFGELTYEEILHELRESRRIIEDITGVRTVMYRPTFGYYTDIHRKIFAAEGFPYTTVWSVNTGDSFQYDPWGNPMSQGYILWRIETFLDDGGIILMHDKDVTIRALPLMIQHLKNEGYTFVTVCEMLPPPEELPRPVYTVKEGDALEKIAERYRVTEEAIIQANIFRGNPLRLVFPANQSLPGYRPIF